MKVEPSGAAGSYLREHVRVADALEASAPRGSFLLQSGERPVVLLGAGIGATPLLAMLYALASARSMRQVLWLYGARDRQHHPFAGEVRRLMRALRHGRSYVCYSRPGSRDRVGKDFDAAGHLLRSALEEVRVSRDADVYLCGPTRFMAARQARGRKCSGVLRAAGSRRCHRFVKGDWESMAERDNRFLGETANRLEVVREQHARRGQVLPPANVVAGLANACFPSPAVSASIAR